MVIWRSYGNPTIFNRYTIYKRSLFIAILSENYGPTWVDRDCDRLGKCPDAARAEYSIEGLDMYGYEICSAGNCLSVFVDTYTTIYIYIYMYIYS